MRLMPMVVCLLLASCSQPNEAMPDAAPMPAVHDLRLFCDSWGSPAPMGCEQACVTPPVARPCGGKEPCYDQPACAVNQRADSLDPATCATTFIATDSSGTHLGCCYSQLQPTPNPYGAQQHQFVYFAECKP